jgi:hypothetical protein
LTRQVIPFCGYQDAPDLPTILDEIARIRFRAEASTSHALAATSLQQSAARRLIFCD